MRTRLLTLTWMIAAVCLAPAHAAAQAAGEKARGGILPSDFVFDSAGNIYVAGQFSGSVDFGKGPVDARDFDAFIAKLSPDGKLAWVHVLSGPARDAAQRLVLDKDGALFAAGTFSGTVSVGGLSARVTSGDTNAFLAKLTPDGRPVWLRGVGGRCSHVDVSLSLDSTGAPVITSALCGSAEVAGVRLTAGEHVNGFVAKYSADGRPLWSRLFGTTVDSYVNAAVLPDDTIFWSAVFRGEADWGGGRWAATAREDMTAAVGTLAADGKPLGARLVAGAAGVAAPLVDRRGNLTLWGGYGCSVKFEGHELTSDACDEQTQYVVSYARGGKLAWAKSFAAGPLYFSHAALGGAGDYVLTGSAAPLRWDGPEKSCTDAGDMAIAFSGSGEPLGARCLPFKAQALAVDPSRRPVIGWVAETVGHGRSSTAGTDELALGSMRLTWLPPLDAWPKEASAKPTAGEPLANAPFAQAPAWSALGAVDRESALGASVANAGDVDGDGSEDVVAADPVGGRIQVFYGAAGEPRPSAPVEVGPVAAVVGAGDVNRDGFSDVAVGVPGYGESKGEVLLFLGGRKGLADRPAFTFEGQSAGERFGSAVAAGDANGDGYPDLLVGAGGPGARGSGRAYLFKGSKEGFSKAAVWTGTGQEAGTGFGASVALCDLDGDRLDELVVGAPGGDKVTADDEFGGYNGGAVFAYKGERGTPSTTAWWRHDDHEAVYGFASALACAGDVNGDGVSDLAVGAREAEMDGAHRGRAYVFWGAKGKMDQTAKWVAEGFGEPVVARVGDVNRDGFADLAVASPSRSKVVVYLGGRQGLSKTVAWSTAEQERPTGASVTSARLARGAAPDLIVGASRVNDCVKSCDRVVRAEVRQRPRGAVFVYRHR